MLLKTNYAVRDYNLFLLIFTVFSNCKCTLVIKCLLQQYMPNNSE